MNLSRLVAAALLILAAACATGPSTSPAPHPDFHVMRHLQKATGADPALTPEGQANAARLAGWFGANPPASIYVSTTRRARETAAPLAARLGITPKHYNPSDTPALIAAVTAEPGGVLIVGHSNTVPEIVERLGGARPADLGDADYGDIWRVYGPDRRVEKLNLIAIGDDQDRLPD